MSVRYEQSGHRQTVRAVVVGNLAVLRAPSGDARTTRIVWHGAGGRAVRTIDPPATYRNTCRRQPGVCLLLRGGFGVGTGSGSSSSESSASGTATATAPRKTR